MPSANLFDFVPQEGIPGVDSDPIQLEGLDSVVFNEASDFQQPAANQIPTKARASYGGPNTALSSALQNTGQFSSVMQQLQSLSLPPEQLLQALQQAFVSSLFSGQ